MVHPNTELKYALDIPSHSVTSEIVPAEKLSISAVAQRDLNPATVAKMANSFVPSAVGTLVVSYRDGVYYIVDGQHRRAAAVKNGVTEFRCEVHHGLTPRQEAALFLIINRESKRVNVADTYRVGLTAGIPLYRDTEAVLISRALRMGAKGVDGIRAIQTVLRITRLYGPEVLAKTLDVVEAAFGRHEGSYDGLVLAGVGLFLHHHPDIPVPDLAGRMKRTGVIDTWIQYVNAEATAQGKRHSGTSSREKAGYLVVLGAWNRGRSANRLPSAIKDF